ncbi:hypothetical protein CEXT_365511 [Caerostris extrusa]|uniref:Uncharacterized protein n=1 Tax=Caerostris extrusa TaxID=172846 RepID=A0AAV4UY68_CAEEX|nr:hypothetical protein CEXT_365511 [Caerostris extrusa]
MGKGCPCVLVKTEPLYVTRHLKFAWHNTNGPLEVNNERRTLQSAGPSFPLAQRPASIRGINRMRPAKGSWVA